MDKHIILGSNSPRRKELLKGLCIDFEIDTDNSFEENFNINVPHEQIPVLMSLGKSHGFHRELAENEILITADTMVLVDGKILGKPHDREDAVRMLKQLSGRCHSVITAVTMRTKSKENTFTDESLVYFKPLADSEIDFYVDRFKPFDKAGAYGVQEWIGYVAIEKIEGSFYNVMGLPVHKVYEALKEYL